MQRKLVGATLTSVLALSLTLVPLESAKAEQSTSNQTDINGDGEIDVVELRPAGDEELILTINGRQSDVRTRLVELRAGAAELRSIDLGNNRQAGLFRAPLARETQSAQEELAFEAILFVRRGAIFVVWSGLTGLRGDRGSRWGDRVIVEDLTGDGNLNILVASIADEVPLCGVQEPELFPRALDPTSGRLRPVMLNRLRSLSVEEITLTASPDNPGAQTETPSINLASWAVASTISGDRGVVEGLSAPRALGDGDPSTSWIEGRPGIGTGEFVTARLLPGPYQIQAIALTLAQRSEGGDPVRELGRARTLTLLLGGSDEVRRYRIEIPNDPSDHPGEPLWVSLPEPLSVNCLSLVLGEVHGGRRAPSSTALTEVAIFSDLDFEGGIERLIQVFSEEEADAEVLLRAIGARAIPILQDRWSDLDTSVQRRSARVMADLTNPGAAELLTVAALSSDSRTASEGRRGLLELGDVALEPLSVHLNSDEASHRSRAARIVSEIGTETALQHLITRTEAAPAEEHPLLRRALVTALGNTGPLGRQAVLERAEEVEVPARLPLLGSLIPVETDEQERFASLVEASWQSVESFEDRYRVLTLAAGGGPVEGLRALAGGVLRDEEDRYLRAHAAEALGNMGNHVSTLSHLTQATRDEWAGVRLSAARAIGRAAPEEGRAALIRLLQQDPWPVVRSTAAEGLALGPADSAFAPLILALDDTSPLVQVTATGLIANLGRADSLPPLLALAQDEDADRSARQAAVRAIGELCSAEAQAALIQLIRTGRDRQTTSEQARIAAAAVAAITFYRGDDVDSLLVHVAQGGVPGLRLAAIEALGRRGGAGAQAALESLAEDPMPPVSAAVADALRQLQLRGDEEAPEARCPREASSL